MAVCGRVDHGSFRLISKLKCCIFPLFFDRIFWKAFQTNYFSPFWQNFPGRTSVRKWDLFWTGCWMPMSCHSLLRLHPSSHCCSMVGRTERLAVLPTKCGVVAVHAAAGREERRMASSASAGFQCMTLCAAERLPSSWSAPPVSPPPRAPSVAVRQPHTSQHSPPTHWVGGVLESDPSVFWAGFCGVTSVGEEEHGGTAKARRRRNNNAVDCGEIRNFFAIRRQSVFNISVLKWLCSWKDDRKFWCYSSVSMLWEIQVCAVTQWDKNQLVSQIFLLDHSVLKHCFLKYFYYVTLSSKIGFSNISNMSLCP